MEVYGTSEERLPLKALDQEKSYIGFQKEWEKIKKEELKKLPGTIQVLSSGEELPRSGLEIYMYIVIFFLILNYRCREKYKFFLFPPNVLTR